MKHFLYGCLFVVILAASCAQPKALEYRGVEHFRVESVSFNGNRIGVDVHFYNPNNYGLEVKGGNIDLYLNDHFLGTSTVEARTVIQKHSDFLVPVAVSASLQDLLAGSLQLLTNKEVTLHLKGTVKVGKDGVFIPVPVDFITQQRIDIK